MDDIRAALDGRDDDVDAHGRAVEAGTVIRIGALRTPGGETEEVDVNPRLAVPDPVPTQVVLIGGAGIGRLPNFMARSAITRGDLVRVLAALEPGSVEVRAL